MTKCSFSWEMMASPTFENQLGNPYQQAKKEKAYDHLNK